MKDINTVLIESEMRRTNVIYAAKFGWFGRQEVMYRNMMNYNIDIIQPIVDNEVEEINSYVMARKNK